MSFMDAYYSALTRCGERYRDMMIELEFPEDDKLFAFTLQFINGCNDQLPMMKLNRWLGYIQGCLIEREFTTVEDERDWTRPLFRPLDFPDL